MLKYKTKTVKVKYPHLKLISGDNEMLMPRMLWYNDFTL